MTDLAPPSPLRPSSDPAPAARLAVSAQARGTPATDLAGVHAWYRDAGRRAYTHVERVELDALTGWRRDPATGDIGHHSGRFFTIHGLDVHLPAAPIPRWHQPIIDQPEVGILGLLVKDIDGVPHLLMQAKVEPGNRNGLQFSPTVQATRSNYTRVHRGRPVPYLDYFRDTDRHRVLADVRQSEQGAWFHRKRNRNLVVEVNEDVEVLDGFRWLTLGQVHELLAEEDLVNMDARTVLSCLPFTGPALPADGDGFRLALLRSCSGDAGSLHPTSEILSWITRMRTMTDVHTRRVPLDGLPGWRRTPERITHQDGLYFDVIGVSVRAGGREVNEWTQPMIAPRATGVIAFLVSRIGGVLHVLVHARAEPGYHDVVELAPTVQGTPATYDALPAEARPRYLDTVLTARPGQIRFDAILSEEGGRFYHARNRYLIVETAPDTRAHPPDYRWLTVHQLAGLLRHSHYLNVQARSLVACLHSLAAAP
ncbi:NDP-hexose 2,3-dehydratase family protein [Marinactinospora rubrisoli]|uniref:NDP-hexose 2,3-dehydratase family protein n=1 Tax=Marinactinospora rubrisoli TaxID=2715399 RepID=A0ABW2KM78_9ACTN